MLHIECQGSPYEVGYKHGSAAKAQVEHSVKFYKTLFKSAADLSWDGACDVAMKFLPLLNGKEEWRDLVEEMRGVADGASQPFPSILALNTRTEIAYGMQKPAQSDGCSAVSWHTPFASLLAQNWDWRAAQSPALISLRIKASKDSRKPSIHMITEAGLIGKIGLSTSGVGVCLNAIRHLGVSYVSLPVHLALRTALECACADEAVATLEKAGVASACHILVADETKGVGLECSASSPIRVLEMDADGVVPHTNHYVLPLPGDQAQTNSHDTSKVTNGTGATTSNTKNLELPDSIPRLARLKTLVQQIRKGDFPNDNGVKDTKGPSVQSLERLFEDEEGPPGSICRFPTGEDKTQTLFGIVMDLKARKGWVRTGRPIEATERVLLDPWGTEA